LDGSEERRKFMDSVLAQTDSAYLDGLIRYNKLLLQRNTLLKQTPRHIAIDGGLLEVLDMQLHDLGTFIFQKRSAFMEIFVEDFNKHYRFLSGGAEQVTLMYDSPLQERPLEEWLAMNFEKDRILERTSVGVHKDDLLFTIHEDKPLKKFGSQGQQKSFLIALKLAQYSYLYAMKGFKPILLLDDIVDRLDEFRITQLMQMVSDAGFGQIFITDTDADRINRIFDSIQKPVRLFTIQGGEVIAQTP
jgi:DNA replication and repair protein RecF